MKGWRYVSYDPFDDAPKEGQFDWGGFWRNIAIGLAVVAVAAVAAAAIIATGGGAAAVFAVGATAGPQMAVGACVGAAIGAAATTANIAIEDFNDGDVRSWQEASLSIGASAISGAITGALGVKFPNMNKFLAGAIDTALSTAERGVVSWFTMDMSFEEWVAYTFDWRQISVDFVAGVGIDYLMDGIGDFFKKHFSPQLTDGLTDELAEGLEESVSREMRESMEEAVEDSVERSVKEAADEATERSAREMADGAIDQIDNVGNSILQARYGDRKISDQLYKKLRSHTPTKEIRDMVNNIEELIGTTDPAILTKVIEGRLEADHIVSMDRIVKKENLPINDAFRTLMLKREKELEGILQQMIDKFISLK